MKIHKYFSIAVACLFSLGLAQISDASLVTFIGSDVGAGELDARPNSDAAAAAFDLAAAAIGTVTTVDFEAESVGAFSSLTIAPGVTMTSVTASATIRNTPRGGGADSSIWGYNTTSGGANFVDKVGGALQFDFTPGINSFGAYVSGLQGTLVGEQTIEFFDGSSQVIDIPEISSGIAFVGFTDAGKSVASVTFEFSNDIVGLDDLRFGRASNNAIPEPTSLVIWGLVGTAGMSFRRRKA